MHQTHTFQLIFLGSFCGIFPGCKIRWPQDKFNHFSGGAKLVKWWGNLSEQWNMNPECRWCRYSIILYYVILWYTVSFTTFNSSLSLMKGMNVMMSSSTCSIGQLHRINQNTSPEENYSSQVYTLKIPIVQLSHDLKHPDPNDALRCFHLQHLTFEVCQILGIQTIAPTAGITWKKCRV